MLYYFPDDCQPPLPFPRYPHGGSHGECHEDDVAKPDTCLLVPGELDGDFDILFHRVWHRDGITSRDIGGIARGTA